MRRLRDFVWAGFASNAAALNAAAAGRIQVGGIDYQGGDRFVYDLCALYWSRSDRFTCVFFLVMLKSDHGSLISILHK